jgi:hypothetical protein
MVDKLMGEGIDLGPAIYELFTKQLNDFALNAEVSHHGVRQHACHCCAISLLCCVISYICQHRLGTNKH